ncbi:hypothetical protein BKA65DRAFT_167977 [Rhexocercosporidium sp. MPI-PUGE-AT-0058]|nr:hypothetical protein BKA65DRAFT_167977 [Rhexocercosporidium sp. MPI-PUGE-AT-0058]
MSSSGLGSRMLMGGSAHQHQDSHVRRTSSLHKALGFAKYSVFILYTYHSASIMPPFTIQQAVPADLDEMVEVWVMAINSDPFWRTMMGSMSKEQEFKFVKENIHHRVDIGVDIGVMQPWKIVDEEKGIAAWTGLSVPKTVTEEEEKLIAPFWDLPPEGNSRARDFMKFQIGTLSTKHGYDKTKHFHRHGSMCRPEYQRQGLMRRLTAHVNAIADDHGAATYVSGRPGASGMFLKEGFVVNEWVDLELGELDEKFAGMGELKNGKTRFRSLKREPGAKATPEKILIEE